MLKHALITGASQGLGAAFALRFAKAGYRIILVARNQTRLEQMARRCSRLNHVENIVITADLTEPETPEKIYTFLQQENISVDVLINNAGAGLWGHFNAGSLQQQQALIHLNITALTSLTYFILQDMRQKHRGTIVNIASVYAYCPVPYQAVYAAGKAFVLSFSMALAEELRDTSITVTCICPGTIATAFRKKFVAKEKPSMFTLSSRQVADLSYSAIQKGKRIYIPGFYNKIFTKLPFIVPKPWLARVIKWMAYRLRGYEIP